MKKIEKNNVKRIKKLFEEKTGTNLADNNTSLGGFGALRRPLPILAVIIVIALTVGAVAVAGGMPGKVRKNVWGDDVELATGDDGSTDSGKLYTFYLDFSLNKDAPSEVEDFYVPDLSNEYRLDMGMIYDGLDNGPIGLTSFHFRSLNGEKGITFSQYADLYDDGIRDNKISVPMGITTAGEEPTVTEAVYGGMMGYLVSGSMNGATYFVWCDGCYVYELTVYTASTVLDELVESVKCVENIRPYLVGMTEEEIDASLK